MANISGTNLAAPIVPFTTDDFYPTHHAQYGKGGWREVATIQERDAIPDARLEQGMSVFVTGENKLYILTALDLEANPQVKTWTLFESGKVDDVQVGNTSVVTNKIALLGTMAGESASDYLPLTGGTVDGLTTFTETSTGAYNLVPVLKLGAKLSGETATNLASISMAPSGNALHMGSIVASNISSSGRGSLGSNVLPWGKIFVDEIRRYNNGSEYTISVPLVSGTMAVQVSSMPTAAATYENKIYQYIGATDATYTNGYFYKCVSDGQSTPTYSWVQIDTQPIPDPLPDQTGNSGKFLTTDGTDASWADALTNTATGTNSLSILGSATGNYSVSIGKSTSASGLRSVSIGGINSGAAYSDSIAIGANAQAGANNAIQLGGSGTNMRINRDANTFKVGNANGNFEIMSADGTVPEARLADTTSATSGQLLKLDSNLDAQWTDLTASDIPSLTLSKISDVTATAAEVNVLDGITASTTELNYVDGVTSNIQTQLDTKAADSDVVHKTGNETINGTKTFNDTLELKNNLSFRSYGSNDSGRLQFRAQPSDNVIRGTVAITDGYTTTGSGYNGFVAQMVARSGNTSSDPFNTMRVSNKGIEYIKEANDGTVTGQYVVVDDNGIVPSDRLATSGSTGQVLTKTASGQSWQTIDALPSQTSQSGKFLTTDGTDASWANLPIEVEWATYGTTTYSQISTWHNNNKVVKCEYNNCVYELTSIGGVAAEFTCPMSNSVRIINVKSVGNVWSYQVVFNQERIPAGTSGDVVTYTGTAGSVGAVSLATVATSGSYADLSNTPTIGDATLTIQKNSTTIDTFKANATTDKTINITVPTTAADVSALPASTKYGANLSLSINSTTYVVTAQLKDQDGNNLGTAQTIDLPLESVVVSGSYDSSTKEVVLTLQGGSTIRFSVADLVSGLQTEITSLNMLDADLVDDSTSAHKFVTASDKTTWSGKQDALVSGTNIKTINNNSLLGSGNITIDSLPTQTGQSGKFLTTDGTDASWSSLPASSTVTFVEW